MAQPIEAVISTANSVVQVSAAVGSAGQALPSTPSSSIKLATSSYGGPVQYKVDAGPWVTLDREQGIHLAIDLSVSTVLLRKATPVGSDVPVSLFVNTVANTAPVNGVPLAAAAPVTISGAPFVGSVLAVSIASGWQNSGGNWTRNGTAISGATNLTYTLVSADVPGPVTYKSSNIPYIPPGLTIAAAPVVPSISVAPVLSAVTAGGSINFTAGTFVGTPTYSLMRGVTVLAANITSGQVVAGTVADDQVFVRLVATSSGQAPAQADSNTVIVASAANDPAMIYSLRSTIPGGTTTVASNNVFSINGIARPAVSYAGVAPRMVLMNFLSQAGGGLELNVGNAITIEFAAYEWMVNGVLTRFPVKSGGSFGPWTLADGGVLITDEDTTMTIPANTPYREVIGRASALGDKFPTMAKCMGGTYTAAGGMYDGIYNSTASQAATYLASGLTWSSTQSNSGLNIAMFVPAFTVCRGWVAAGKPAVPIVIGDSVGAGADELSLNTNNVTAVVGFIDRGLMGATVAERVPSINFCIPGNNYAGATSTTFAKRAAMLAAVGHPYSVMLSEMGTNAGSGNDAIIGFGAYSDYLKTMSGGKPLVQTTMCAKGSGVTDASYGWTVPSNIIPHNMEAFSVWVRSRGKTPAVINGTSYTTNNIDAYIEIEDRFSVALGDPRWKAMNTLSATIQTDWVTGNSMILDAAPASGAILWVRNPGGTKYTSCKVNSVSAAGVPAAGQYTVAISGSTSPPTAGTYEAGSTVVELPTKDGIHPTTNAHIAAAPVITAARLTALKF